MGNWSVGNVVTVGGNVTQLHWIWPGAERETEAAIGYAPGRLAQGYFILVLVEPLSPTDFEFDGTTLRSGGREGLPAATAAEDAARRRVHDLVTAEYGAAQYREMRRRVLDRIETTGRSRIAKIAPAIRHDDSLAPKDQYPPGGGGLQWKITRARRFLIAAQIQPGGRAKLPGLDLQLGASGWQARYDARARLRRHLETVTA